MSIFSHIFVGTNDLGRARKFYDAVLATFGLKRVLDAERASGWGRDAPAFLVTKPINGLPATFANGGTIGFAAQSRAAVRELHKAAMANGATDEGAPGPRPHISPTAYGAYVRDADGNKLCSFCFSPD